MWSLRKGALFLPNVSVKKLQQLYAVEKNIKAKLRLLAAIRRKKGGSIDDIARAIEKPRKTIHGWLHRFEERGLQGSYDKKQPGRTPLLTPSQLKKLRRELLKGPPHIPSGMWEMRQVRDHIQKKYGVSYKRHNIFRLLNALGFSVQKPRPRHFKSDPRAQEQFKKKQSGFQHSIAAAGGRLPVWTSVASTFNPTLSKVGRSKEANLSSR